LWCDLFRELKWQIFAIRDTRYSKAGHFGKNTQGLDEII